MDIFELNFEDWAEVSYVYEIEKKKKKNRIYAWESSMGKGTEGERGFWEVQTI